MVTLIGNFATPIWQLVLLGIFSFGVWACLSFASLCGIDLENLGNWPNGS